VPFKKQGRYKWQQEQKEWNVTKGVIKVLLMPSDEVSTRYDHMMIDSYICLIHQQRKSHCFVFNTKFQYYLDLPYPKLQQYVDRRSCRMTMLHCYKRVVCPVKEGNGWTLITVDFGTQQIKGNNPHKFKQFL
jgi:hypothetical protein